MWGDGPEAEMSANLCVGVEDGEAKCRDSPGPPTRSTLVPHPPVMLERPIYISSHTTTFCIFPDSAEDAVIMHTAAMTCACTTPTHLLINSLYAAHPSRSQIDTVGHSSRPLSQNREVSLVSSPAFGDLAYRAQLHWTIEPGNPGCPS
jgi:hypothetical protein